MTHVVVEPARPEHNPHIRALSAITGSCTNIERECQKDETRVWVAKFATRVVGYLVFWEVADELQIVDLAVFPEFRRQGVGSTLLQRLKTEGVERQASCIVLEVRAGNRAAIELYAEAGFRVVRRRENYYSGNEDGLELVWVS